MTDQRDKAITEPASGVEMAEAAPLPKSISRRALMGGASVALPTILTLNSNAAFGWAVTSGTIGTRAASATATGDAICVVGQEQPGAKAGVYAVGESDFYRIDGSLYYKTDTGNSGTALSPEQVCEHEGVVYVNDRATGNGQAETKTWVGAVASVSYPGAMASLSANNINPEYWP